MHHGLLIPHCSFLEEEIHNRLLERMNSLLPDIHHKVNLGLHRDHFTQKHIENLKKASQGLIIFFATFGPDTLKEFQHCMAVTTHYPDMHDIGDLLNTAEFKDCVMEQETILLAYKNFNEIIEDLNLNLTLNLSIGEHDKDLTQLEKHYEDFRNQEGYLPATIEIIYGHAIGPSNIPRKIPAALCQ